MNKNQVIIPRYSDAELLEFKQMILNKIEEEQNFLADEENPLTRQHTADFIYNLGRALLRIENKSYGRDAITGELICRERLERALCATVSVESKPLQKIAEQNKAMEKRAKTASVIKMSRERLESSSF